MATNKYAFHVEMTCSGCSNAVKKVLSKLGDKVQNADIDLEQKLVTVDTVLSKEEMIEILKKTGKENRANKTK